MKEVKEVKVAELPGWKAGDWVVLQRTLKGIAKGSIVEIIDMMPSKGAKLRDHETGREEWTQGTDSLRVVRRTRDWATDEPVLQVLAETTEG